MSMTASRSMGETRSWSGVISRSAKVLRVRRPRYLCSSAFPGSLWIVPRTLTSGQYASNDVRSFVSCCPPDTLFRITPAILTSGSKDRKPLTMAAALRVRDRASTTSITGSPRSLAMCAVEPRSPSPEKPSYRPRTPSTTHKSASLDAYPTRFLIVPSSMRNESRFLAGRPVAAVWYMGSMKSGPALNAWTLWPLDSLDMSPVATDVLPTPLPVPEITNPLTASPSGSGPSPTARRSARP